MTEKSHFKTRLETILNIVPEGYSETALERICFRLVKQAIQGDLKTITFIRDTIGQQPFKEMILAEYTSNPALEKLDSILIGLKQTAEAESVVIIDDIQEDQQFKNELFDKLVEDFGKERLVDYVKNNRALYGLQDLGKQIFSNDE